MIRRWAVCDYDTTTGERISTVVCFTRGGAARLARLHRGLFGTRGGQYELRVERRP